MLIRSAPEAEGGELGGDDAWRTEDREVPRESRAGCFTNNIRSVDVHGKEELLDVWEAVKPATRTDPVAVVRRDWMGVLEEGLMHRRGSEGNAIT